MDEFEDIVIHKGNEPKIEQTFIPDGSIMDSKLDIGVSSGSWTGIWASDSNTGLYRSGSSTISFSVNHDHDMEFLKMKFILGQIKDQDAIKQMIEWEIDGLDQCETIEEWRKERASIEQHIRNGGSLDHYLSA